MGMKKKIAFMAVTAAFLASTAFPAFAQNPASVADLIKQLEAQIQALKTQIIALQNAQKGVAQAAQDVRGTLKLLGQLHEGMTGDDVKLLQTALAADPEIYPEALITGFYGRLTANAVKKFQKKHGFEQAGNVGPKTLKKLNEFLEENKLSEEDEDEDGDEDEDEDEDKNENRGKRHCVIVPPGHLIAPGWLKKHNGERPLVPVCQTLPPGILKKLPPAATTTPPTTPPPADTATPIISGISASSTASTSASIMWTTNEPATSKAYYGTTTPLSMAGALTVSNSTLVTSHLLTLSSLSASTTYYYILESKDAANNTATSSEKSVATQP